MIIGILENAKQCLKNKLQDKDSGSRTNTVYFFLDMTLYTLARRYQHCGEEVCCLRLLNFPNRHREKTHMKYSQFFIFIDGFL